MRGLKSILISNASVLDVIKNIIEIIALGIAATWALYNFEIKEAPALEESASSSFLIKAEFFMQGKKGFISTEHFHDDTYTFRLHETARSQWRGIKQMVEYIRCVSSNST